MVMTIRYFRVPQLSQFVTKIILKDHKKIDERDIQFSSVM